MLRERPLQGGAVRAMVSQWAPNRQSTECGHGDVAFHADIQGAIQKRGQTNDHFGTV